MSNADMNDNESRRGDPNTGPWGVPAGYEVVTDDSERGDEPGALQYMGRLWRRKWLIAAILIPCIVASVFVARRADPAFIATARLRLGVQSPKIAPFQPAEERTDARTESLVQTQINIFQSRTIAGQVVEQLGYNPPPPRSSAIKDKLLTMALGPRAAAPNLTGESARRERAVDAFLMGLTVLPIADTQIFEARYSSIDPEFSARALNALCDAYLKSDFQTKSASYSEARRWLQEKMNEVKTDLAKSEESLYKFTGADGAQFMTLSDGGLQYAKELDELRLKIAAIEDEFTKRKADRDRLAAGGLPEDAAGAGGGASLASTLRGQLATADIELEKVKQTLGPMDSSYKNAAAARDRLATQLADEKSRLLQVSNLQFKQTREQLAQLRNDYETRQRHVIALQQRLSGYNSLKREVDLNRETYNNLQRKWQEIGIGQSIQPADAVILQRAERPLVPIYRARNNILVYGLLIGLCLSFGAAMLADRLDTSLKDSEEIWRLGRIETLGHVAPCPTIRLDGRTIDPGLLMHAKPDSAAAESIRSLRASIEYLCEGPRALLVTSAMPREGKTTVAANLAISFAQKGRSVLLIDSDLRGGNLRRIFEIDNETGLAGLLACGRACIDEFVAPTRVPRLFVIPSGSPKSNPADLLDADAMRLVLDSAAERFDLVIVDSVSLRTFADAGVTPPIVDGVIIVAQPGRTPRREFLEMNRLLGVVGARVVGVALNNSKSEPARIHEVHRGSGRREPVFGNGNGNGNGRGHKDERIAPAAMVNGYDI